MTNGLKAQHNFINKKKCGSAHIKLSACVCVVLSAHNKKNKKKNKKKNYMHNSLIKQRTCIGMYSDDQFLLSTLLITIAFLIAAEVPYIEHSR